jgi:hypothetical protein
LTTKAYLDYLCDDTSSQDAVYIPINTVTPGEQEGLTFEEERKLRVFGCDLIQLASVLLKMPNLTSTTA